VRNDLYIIECRDFRGSLDFSRPQPEEVFGMAAITGITEDGMAKTIFRRQPEATLQGDRITQWPKLFDSRWTARRKTW